MKTPNTNMAAARGASKNKMQLIVLGSLTAVLVAVLASQFSGGEDAVAATEPALEVATGGLAASADRIGEAVALSAAPDNEALSEQGDADSVSRSPFESFWSTAAPVDTTIDEIPAPSIIVNGTMTSGQKPVAVIDGETHFLGDIVQGWKLVSIDTRAVGLESPTRSRISVEMPLLQVKNRRNL